MHIPALQACECGHLGSSHRSDGTCRRCECEEWRKPIHSYSRGGKLTKKGKGAMG